MTAQEDATILLKQMSKSLREECNLFSDQKAWDRIRLALKAVVHGQVLDKEQRGSLIQLKNAINAAVTEQSDKRLRIKNDRKTEDSFIVESLSSALAKARVSRTLTEEGKARYMEILDQIQQPDEYDPLRVAGLWARLEHELGHPKATEEEKESVREALGSMEVFVAKKNRRLVELLRHSMSLTKELGIDRQGGMSM